MINVAAWRTGLSHALPFYYGWVIVGNGVAVSLSTRTVMAVATLSVFVVPMTQSLGWSVGMFSGAVSLGGLAAVFVSPIVGRWLDKYGAGVILGAGSLATGAVAIGLAFVAHPLAFYFLYVPGRMIFAGPMEMGLPTAISNWFIRRRPMGLAVDAIAKGAGLAIAPWAMQLIITGHDWRTAWIALGILTFALGVLPSLLRWRGGRRIWGWNPTRRRRGKTRPTRIPGLPGVPATRSASPKSTSRWGRRCARGRSGYWRSFPAPG